MMVVKAMINVIYGQRKWMQNYSRKGSLIDEHKYSTNGTGTTVWKSVKKCVCLQKVGIWASGATVTDLQGNPLNPSKPVVIGRQAWRSAGVNVMKGVTMGEHTTHRQEASCQKTSPSLHHLAGSAKGGRNKLAFRTY